MRCDEAQPMLAAHAAGALDDTERDAVDAHVDGCAACRAELDALCETASLLVEAGPLLDPPPGLKAELLDRIDRESVTPAARDTPTGDSFGPGTPWSRRRVGWVALGAAAGVLIVLGPSLIDWNARAIDPAEAWRLRVAQTEQALGVPGKRLVEFRVDAPEGRLVDHLLYDRLSRQVHLWTVVDPLIDTPPMPDHVWIVGIDGRVLGHAAVDRSSDRLVATIDVAGEVAGGAAVVFTSGPIDAVETPSGVEVGRARIAIESRP